MWLHNLDTSKPCAFFDVDNTLISIKSMFSFLNYLQQNTVLIPQQVMTDMQAKLKQMFAAKERRENINAHYYKVFAGVSVAELSKLGRQWYREVAAEADFFHPHALARLRQHQQQGYNLVFVSGSGLAMLQPLAEALGVNTVLCAPQEQHDGKYTGELVDRPCIGEGKAHYMRRYLRLFTDITAQSVAYGDDISDFPMLATVGRGYLVSPSELTRQANREQDFTILDMVREAA